MKLRGLLALASGCLLASACNDSPSNFPTNSCSDVTTGTCIEIQGGDSQALLDAVNSIEANTTIILGKGTFSLTNGVYVRSAGFRLVGQGIDVTTLDFGPATGQFNGVDVIGDGFLVQDVTVLDAPKDGIRVESSNGVTFRRIRATWSTPGDSTNGAYGIYPVKSQNVLVEDSRAENASDAGLYVGQCQNVIVRNNVVTGNVAGLEIENTQYADVYNNEAYMNTGGIVVFDLPGNPIIGRDVRLRDNNIHDNNGENFAPGGTVQQIPVGTGTFAMASRRVEITGNTYKNNNTVDIAIISGLAVEQNTALWQHNTADLVGTWQDLNLLPGAAPNTVTNFRSENVLVANNTHMGSGTAIDPSPKQINLLLASLYGANTVDNILYDTIGESQFNGTTLASNSNDNHLCVGGNPAASFASLNFPNQPGAPILRITAGGPYGNFGCNSLNGGPVQPVTIP